MIPTSILLFAAGFGTRMAPLTKTRPKPLVEVDGKPLLDHAIERCDGLRIVVNAHYLSDQIIGHLEDTDCVVSDETDKILDTGGGLKRALPLLESNPTFTMNTDAVWCGPNPIDTLRDTWISDSMDALLLMIPRDAAVGHTGKGDFDIGPDGRLTRGADFVYAGVQIIKTDGLLAITKDEFSMWELWSGMLERRSMHGVAYTGQWCDVGRPENIPMAQSMLRGNLNV